MWKIHWAKLLQFQPHGVFAGILSRYLGQKCLLFSMIKERSLYSAVYYIMNYMYLILVAAFVAFTNIKPFGEELDCSRESIVPMAFTL